MDNAIQDFSLYYRNLNFCGSLVLESILFLKTQKILFVNRRPGDCFKGIFREKLKYLDTLN